MSKSFNVRIERMMSYVDMWFSIPNKDYIYLMTVRKIERPTIVLSLRAHTLLNNSISREMINLYDSTRGLSTETTSDCFEMVGEMLLITIPPHNFKASKIPHSTAMLNSNGNRLNEDALWLTTEPIDGTNKTRALRDRILANK